MSGLSSPLLAAIFVGAAAAIWVAGIQLSEQTDVLSTRLLDEAKSLGLVEPLHGSALTHGSNHLPSIACSRFHSTPFFRGMRPEPMPSAGPRMDGRTRGLFVIDSIEEM